MTKVTSDMSMSLDGFITGPNDDVSRPLGEGGERLHQWVYELASWRERHGLAGGKTNRDAEVLDEAWHVGAVVMGRRTDGVESALKHAKAAADGKDVSVAGGASIVQQFLKEGLLDEIQIHLVPVVLGGGRRLFEHIDEMEFEPGRVIESPGVTHLRFRVKSRGDRHG